MTNIIFPDILPALIAYLSDPEDPSDVWGGIRLMESLGLDLGLRSVQLHSYLTDGTLSPLPDAANLSAEEERRVVLSLREQARRELGLPALSEDEWSSWTYVPRTPFHWPGDRSGRPQRRLDRRERASVLEAMNARNPALIAALRAFADHNEALGRNYSAKASTDWAYFDLMSLIYDLQIGLNYLETHNLVIELGIDNYSPEAL